MTLAKSIQILPALRAIVPEYFVSFRDPYTYNPLSNLYTLFGFAWGIPVPFVTVGLVIVTLGMPFSPHSMVSVIRTYHFLFIFLVHPILFYLVFGALGTIHKRREEQIRSEAAKAEAATKQMVVRERMAMIGQLAAGVAHEINNPVCILLAKTGYLKTLEGKPFVDQAVKDLDKFESHLMRIGAITKGLLSFARQSVDLAVAVNFPQLLLDTLVFMEHVLKKNNITVVKELRQQRREFDGCAGELQQVFLNIIGNAIDAMLPAGEGTLSVSFRESQEGFVIAIGDSGTGIPDAIKARVMEPFFSTKDVGKGTGLGLSISYGIVTKHHGTVRFDSAPGKGTTFFLEFPFQKDAA